MKWDLPKKWPTGSIFMDEGAIVEVGTPAHFFTDPTHDRTKLFSDPDSVGDVPKKVFSTTILYTRLFSNPLYCVFSFTKRTLT